MTDRGGRTNPKRPGPPRSHPFTDASRGPRLHKVLAEAGVGSRRACEALIESGAVTVNGHLVAALPAWVDPRRDHLAVHRRRVRTTAPHVYVILFKPRGVVCTNHDPAGRPRAVDLVRHRTRCRLFPVGRLDADSSGLLLLTNDGDLAHRIAHPRFGVHKVYEVTVDGALDAAAVRKLEAGVFLTDRRGPGTGRDGRRTGRSRLRLLRTARDRTKLLMELREGRNRQIRRMMHRVGHSVRRLRRVRLGPLTLAGLRPGQWRDLRPQEIQALRRAVSKLTRSVHPPPPAG